MPRDIPRIVISATNSGAGKSTITMGILMALKDRGLAPQSFKVGPDHIDPMYHTMATGKECRNMDPWMFYDEVERLFVEGSEGSGISVVEGVMGLYDGASGITEDGSTAHMSKMIKAPVILVIDSKSTSRSAGAIALGFKEYDKDVNIAGVIFNRVGSQRHLAMLKESLRGIPCLGAVFADDCMAIESRNLGLVPSESYDSEKYDRIKEHIEKCVDMDKLIEVARSAPPIQTDYVRAPAEKAKVRIGVAKDKAFSFYYIHNIESLESAGAEIVYFSPLEDDLPEVDGMYIGGGYPEMYAEEIEKNKGLRDAVRKASEDGMPIYAECGGLLYLSKNLTTVDGRTYEMCGAIDADSNMNKSRKAMGFVELRSDCDNVICEKGWTARGHEFHFSTVSPSGTAKYAFTADRENKGIADRKDGIMVKNTVAGYAHLHFASNPNIPKRFVAQCLEYSRS